MTLPRDHSFAGSAFRLRSDLAALAFTVVAAIGILALDLGTTASAADGLDAAKAVVAARAQGFEGPAVVVDARYDRVARRSVWDVRSDEGEHAVIDAASGDLVSLDF